MSNTREGKADEALREYLEAYKNYQSLHDKYFPVRPVIPGVPTTTGRMLTEEAVKELEEAETKVADALKKYDKLIGL